MCLYDDCRSEAAAGQDGSAAGSDPAGDNAAVDPHSSMAAVGVSTAGSAGTAACGCHGADTAE